MELNTKLKQYVETEILVRYQSNDKGHGIDHINYVINRSIKFARTLEGINMNMVYTIACYHDIGHSIDAKRHEEISAQILLNDDNLKLFFTDDEILIMSEAVFDHRASLEYEPRSIYGKIISSADRNTSVEDIFKRTYEYCIVHMPESSLREIIDASYDHVLNKFGKKGYATKKIYFEDYEYKQFLLETELLLSNREEFNKRYLKINNLIKE